MIEQIVAQRDILAEWASYSFLCPMDDNHKCEFKSSDKCTANTNHPECWVRAAELEHELRISEGVDE